MRRTGVIAALALLLAVAPLTAQAKASATTVRTLTFNIHHGAGVDGKLDLERVAQTIEASGAGVVGLQEVDKYFDARSNWLDQPAWLAARLKMNYVFAANLDWDPAEPGKPRRQYGTLVLSKYPIVDSRKTLLPIVTLLKDAPEATVLVGDLNAVPTSTEVKTLTTHWTDTWPQKGLGLGLTSPMPFPSKRIDYQLHSSQLVPTAASVPLSFASDHLPVAATYTLS